mmetsp:Transcript_73483/g.122984  ORF Transcript_73483/g.122984 Transcript_73483/m.122984 type:complete len:224 (+) Transcript_73483:402-1073(+)
MDAGLSSLLVGNQHLNIARRGGYVFAALFPKRLEHYLLHDGRTGTPALQPTRAIHRCDSQGPETRALPKESVPNTNAQSRSLWRAQPCRDDRAIVHPTRVVCKYISDEASQGYLTVQSALNDGVGGLSKGSQKCVVGQQNPASSCKPVGAVVAEDGAEPIGPPLHEDDAALVDGHVCLPRPIDVCCGVVVVEGVIPVIAGGMEDVGLAQHSKVVVIIGEGHGA